MKKIISFVFLSICVIATVNAQSTVTADITNLKSDKGVCRVCLFNSEASFKGETGEPFKCLTVPAKNKAAQASFADVPAGTYAMFVFHDANNNNKMDKNFLGIPKEGYGASKNKLPFASAPTFDDNKFSVDSKGTVRLKISLRNL